MEIHFLHIENCPNSSILLGNLNKAVKKINNSNIKIINIIVNSPELAKKYKFLGSPTILINGKDFEGFELPVVPNYSCRYYSNGIPSVDYISNKIETELNIK